MHSARDDDLGVVYDNKRDPVGRGHSLALNICGEGMAHLNPEPFNNNDPWGWGRGWRNDREFVGRVSYGVRWMLWGPETHRRFPPKFRNTVMILMAGANRPDSVLYWLPHEVRLVHEHEFWTFSFQLSFSFCQPAHLAVQTCPSMPCHHYLCTTDGVLPLVMKVGWSKHHAKERRLPFF